MFLFLEFLKCFILHPHRPVWKSGSKIDLTDTYRYSKLMQQWANGEKVDDLCDLCSKYTTRNTSILHTINIENTYHTAKYDKKGILYEMIRACDSSLVYSFMYRMMAREYWLIAVMAPIGEEFKCRIILLVLLYLFQSPHWLYYIVGFLQACYFMHIHRAYKKVLNQTGARIKLVSTFMIGMRLWQLNVYGHWWYSLALHSFVNQISWLAVEVGVFLVYRARQSIDEESEETIAFAKNIIKSLLSKRIK